MAAGKAAAVKKPSFGTRAWRLLRLAVLWARRGGVAHSLRLLRTLRRHGHGLGGGARGDRLRYGEREFSIDETPAFRFRTPSARVLRLIPCIAPAVPDTPGLYGDDHRYFFRDAAARALEEDGAAYGYGAPESERGDDDGEEEELSCYCDGGDEEEELLERAVAESCRASTAAEGDAGVDVKADEFIARFYAQMKLQRQISWLQYNEMMQRSVS
ncbi:uncharacterized protein LOC120652646 [Panicum virgatum]|uniref:Uncharacterized protein n=1 Tax=Panicum virgatum TaxID=38727 RepID=A0A8T0NUP4_PANVG|nr:uncharacterized protein LOC120652646 [Panicum virgatum]KAG2552538.1 hypothetical protein PVAP13_9KG467600 [Panicum virgatum]